MDGYGDYEQAEDLETPVLAPMAPAHMAAVVGTGAGPMYSGAQGAVRPPAVMPPMAMPGMPTMRAPSRRALAGPMPSMNDPSLGAVEEALPTSHLLGLSVILPTIGTIGGMKYGGLYGGLGGALGMGSLLNGFRAVRFMMRGDQDSDKEALISGTYAVLGLAASAFLFYKGLSGAKPNKTKPEDDDTLAGVE